MRRRKTLTTALGIVVVCWQMKWMARTPKSQRITPIPTQPEQLAPVTGMLSSRLMVLANLLKRSATLRYRRTAGLSSVEFGLVANLGRNPPMSVARLATTVGLDKGQISRALAELVDRKLVSRHANPSDNREVLVALTKSGLLAHDILLSGGIARGKSLVEDFDADELKGLLRQIDRLTERAETMLSDERAKDIAAKK